MCCLLSILLLLGARLGGTLWWLASPQLWWGAFSSWLWALLGLAYLPWTTLMYVWVFAGGVTGSEWLLIAFATAVDLAFYSGSAYRSSSRSVVLKSSYNPY